MVSREETAKIEYTLPDPAEAYKQAGAAFKGAPWIGQQQYAQSEEVMAAAQQLSEVVDHANLKAAKAEALDDLDKQINGTADGEIRQQLIKIRDRVMAAHSKDAVSEAIAMARTGAIAADAKYAGKDDMQQDRISDAHQELYAKDAVYRAEMDKITGEVTNDRKQSDARDKNTDAKFKDAGIVTSVDEELEEKKKKLAGLRDPEDQQEIIRINAEINKLRITQNEERIERAKEIDRPDLVELGESEKPKRDAEFEKSMEEYEKAKTSLFKAKQRALEANPQLTPQQRKEIMNETIASFEEDEKVLLENGQIKTVKKRVEVIANQEKALEKESPSDFIKRQANDGSLEANNQGSSQVSAHRATDAFNEAVKTNTTTRKFEVATASAADVKTPTATPGDDFTAVVGTVRSS